MGRGLGETKNKTNKSTDSQFQLILEKAGRQRSPQHLGETLKLCKCAQMFSCSHRGQSLSAREERKNYSHIFKALS